MGMIGFGFGLVGLGMAAAATYIIFSRLFVTVDRQEVVSTRTIFGKAWVTRARLEEIVSLDKKVTGQSGQGADAVIYYKLLARRKGKGKPITLGDHIIGQEEIDRLINIIKLRIGLDA